MYVSVCVCVCVCVCVLDPFHLQRVNKLYRKYKPVKITQKEHMLIWNSETTQKPKHLSSPNRSSYFSSYKAWKNNYGIQLFKFFHTENTSNFKTQTAKNGGFFEELLSENDFEAVLVNFCCYEYGANASEAVQKISTRILLRVSHSGGKHHYNFFRPPPPPPHTHTH